MDKIYSQFDLLSFKKVAIFAFLLGDLIFFNTIYRNFTSLEFYNQIIEILLQVRPDIQGGFNEEIKFQLLALYKNALIFLLGMAFLYHLFVNFLWWKGKYVARGYLALYAWTAGPLITLAGLFSLFSSPLKAMAYLIVGLLFLFCAIGMGYFREENPKEKKGSKPPKRSVR